MVSSPNFSSQGTNVYAQLLPGSLQQKHHIVAGRDGNMTASTAQQAHLHGNLRGSQHQKSELKKCQAVKNMLKKATLNSKAKLNDSCINLLRLFFCKGGRFIFQVLFLVVYLAYYVFIIYHSKHQYAPRIWDLRLETTDPDWPFMISLELILSIHVLTPHFLWNIFDLVLRRGEPPSMWAKIEQQVFVL